MNPFLIDNIPYRAVYMDNPNGMGEERGGCWSFATKEVTECQYCPYQKACPADGEDE